MLHKRRSRSIFHGVCVLSGLLYLLHLGYAIGTWRCLYADGAYFFVLTLEDQSIHIEGGSIRLFAQLLFQWPVVLATNVGIRHLPTLLTLQGLGLFIWFPLSLAICWWAAKARRRYLLFPLACTFAGSMNAEFDVANDSHRLACLFWPLLFIMLFRYGRPSRLLLMLLAAPTIMTYESMLFLGPFLAAVAIIRGRSFEFDNRMRGFYFGLATWFVIGTCVALHATWNPNPQLVANRDDFARALSFPVLVWTSSNYEAIYSLGILVGILFVLSASASKGILNVAIFLPRSLYSEAFWKAVICAGALTIIVCGIVVAVLPVFAPSTLNLHTHHTARVLNLFLPLGLGSAMFWIWHQGIRIPPRIWRICLTLVLWLGIVQSLWHIAASYQWQKYLQTFQQELLAANGIRPFEETVLNHLDEMPHHNSHTMNWFWTSPLMSIILAPNGQVQTIIENPIRFRLTWEPFNTRDPEQWPELTRYGITYRIADTSTCP